MGAALGAALVVLALALGQLWHRMAGLGRYGARWRTAEVLGHGLPFLLMRVNVWFTAGADLWVLGMFRPPEEVAIYGLRPGWRPSSGPCSRCPTRSWRR